MLGLIFSCTIFVSLKTQNLTIKQYNLEKLKKNYTAVYSNYKIVL